MSYAMNRPMSWETFKSMPLDLQQSYLDGLHSRFGVGAATVGKELFDLSSASLNNYIRRNGLKNTPGKRLSNKERELWENWLNPPVEPIKEEPVEDTPEEPETVEPVTHDPIEEVKENPVVTQQPMELPVLRVSDRPSNVIHPDPISIDRIINDPNATGGTYEQVLPYPAPTRGFQLLPKEEKQCLEVSDLSATFKGKFEPAKFLKWVSQLPMPDGQVKIRVEVVAQ